MANDINSVYIQVIADTGEVQRNLNNAEKAFLGLNKKVKKTGGLSKSITREFAKMAAGIFAVERAFRAASVATTTMFKDISDFQRIQVELKVATGSAVLAEGAFAMLKDTASKLPSSLQDVTTGFIRLRNMGLEASQETLISFSNTAAAMGKSLKQFVEGVADANTREFERLKEFGILARNQGDTIRFVFRGMTTDVRNSSKDIVQYLTDIGNNEFAGAATDQIDTLASRVTKLRDAIFELNIAIGSDSAGAWSSFIKYGEDAIRDVTKAVEDSRIADLMQPDFQASGWRGWINDLLSPLGRGRKSAEELQKIFSDLGARDLPAAGRAVEAALVKARATGAKADYDALNAMREGLAVAQKRVDAEKAEADAKEKKIAADFKAGQISLQQDERAEKLAEFALERRVEIAKREDDVLALKELQVVAAEKLAKAQEKLDSLDEAVESEAIRNKFYREYNQAKQFAEEIEDEITDIHTDQEEERAKETARLQKKAATEEANRRKKALSDYFKDFEDMLDKRREEIELEQKIGGIQQYNLDQQQKRQLEILKSTGTEAQKLGAMQLEYQMITNEIEAIQAKLEKGGMGAQEVIDANAELDAYTGQLISTGEAIKEQKKSMDEWSDSLKEMFDDVREGIADAVVEGEGFKGVLQSILKEMAKTQIMKGLGMFGTDGNQGSGIFGAIQSMFRARGGPVTANKPYIVGERGPELFTPSGSGSITPNNRMRTGGSSNVNVVNNFNVSGGVDQQTQRMIAQSVSTSVQLAVAKIDDNKRRGVR